MKKISIYLISVILLMFISIIPVYSEESYIKLSQDSVTLGLNTETILKINTYGDAQVTNPIWKSDNPNIVDVTNGKITGKSIGTTIIRVISGNYRTSCKVNVISDYISITGLKLKNSSGSVVINGTQKIEPLITPDNASNKFVIYRSSNEEIATVDQNGVITGKKLGSTIITVKSVSSPYTATYSINVIDKINLNSISINKTLEIKEQATAKINITYNPTNATNKKVTWKSSNEKIATVDSSGNVKALLPGTVEIKAISEDGSHVAICKVTVTAISKKLLGITIDKKEVALDVDKTTNIKVTFNPTYAENKKVTWSSSNEKVATVKDGIITAIKPGTAEITVKSEEGNYEQVCKVTVLTPPIQSIAFEKEEQTIYLGEKSTLKTIANPTESAINEPIWTSSNPDIITVENGIVEALAIGESTITISDKEGKIKATTKITVIEKPQEPLNIKVLGYNLNFDPNTHNYTLKIGNENSLSFEYNIDESKVLIKGNRDLKDGSIITITVTDEEKVTYVINIKKKLDYTLYFIGIISFLLLLNIIRMLIKNNKKNK